MERKLYKTKLCLLYQRGRCSRQSCSFAHGEAELRRLPPGAANDVAGLDSKGFIEDFAQFDLRKEFDSEFNDHIGRREYRGGDLRDRLERRHSPYRRYSPERDVRGRPAVYGQKQPPRDRGYSLSRSPIRWSERRHLRKQHHEGESNDSRSPEFSDDGDQPKEGKAYIDNEKDDMGEKLKEIQLDIESLDESKRQLEAELREKAQESDKLNIHIQELESQLSQEREDCRKLMSKNKKFVKALGRYVRAQDELKRSQARLQKLADQLGSDVQKSGANEEDSSINIPSDGELNHIGGRQDTNSHASPLTKRARLSTGSSKNKERFLETVSDRPIAPSENGKETDANTVLFRNEVRKMVADDQTHKNGKNGILLTALEKAKTSERGSLVPSTSIPAHAIDDLLEAVEVDEKSVTAEANTISQTGGIEAKTGLRHLPPLPLKIIPNAYIQYEDDDEEVDVVDVEMEAGEAVMVSDKM